MKTNQEHFSRIQNRMSELGSGLVYVLVAVGLFGALSFTLMRTTDTGEAATLSDEQAELYASQLVAYAGQTKNVIDQMYFTGTEVDELDFSLPGTAAFNSAPHIHKIYHPDGGGLNPGKLPSAAVNEITTNPTAGWYMGRFNDVEWSNSTQPDGVLVAYQINEKVCGLINEKVTGSSTIPAISTTSLRRALIDDNFHTDTNTNFLLTHCPSCDGYMSLCVSNAPKSAWAYYNIFQEPSYIPQ